MKTAGALLNSVLTASVSSSVDTHNMSATGSRPVCIMRFNHFSSTSLLHGGSHSPELCLSLQQRCWPFVHFAEPADNSLFLSSTHLSALDVLWSSLQSVIIFRGFFSSLDVHPAAQTERPFSSCFSCGTWLCLVCLKLQSDRM